MRSTSAGNASFLVSLLAAVVAVILGWASARGLDTLWDEQVDLEIARGLLDHPLTGGRPTLDPSQTRLPMYVNAIAFAVSGRKDLAVSRGVSLLFAAVTIVAAGSLGRMLFGPLVGALAAVFLALSPYFLSFARVAMTEGDVFFACLSTLTFCGYVSYVNRPTPGRWLGTALLMGLALGAKAFGGIILVGIGGLEILARPPRHTDRSGSSRDVRRLYRLLAAGVIIILATGAAALAAKQAAIAGRDALASASHWASIAGWGVLLGVWCVCITFVLRRRALPHGRLTRFAGMAMLAVITFFAVMPVHLLDHDLARALIRRAVRWDQGLPLGLWTEHVRLYAGILLVKLTVPLGILTVVSLILGAVHSRSDARWRLCTLIPAFYAACLCFLPLRQSFYLMGVYPLVMILLAACLVHAGRRRKPGGRWAGAGGCVLAGCLLLHLALNHVGVTAPAAYPHYHLHGYATVSDRWLGAQTRGYRNLIQTPSDGVESLIQWCEADTRVRKGDRVVSFLWEQAIIDAALPPKPRYELVPRGVTPESSSVPPQPLLRGADFVLLHINNRLGYGDHGPDWPPESDLAAEFVVVHTVRRGSLEIGWVFGRRR